MQKFEVEGHAPSLLPDGLRFKQVWADEFDGDSLDRSKWGFRLHFWGKRFPTFTDEGVEVSDSCVRLYMTYKDGIYRAPFLQTGSLTYDIPKEEGRGGFCPFGAKEKPKFQHKYGYYECRCKLQRHPGWWSAFWLQAPGIGATCDPAASGVECDVMESFQPGYVIPHCLHYNGYGADYRGFNSHNLEKLEYARDGIAVSLDEFHYFGVLWEKDGYTFYIDGKQSGEKVNQAVSHTEQFILLSCECKGYRETGTANEELLSFGLKEPDCFTVDHVRVFDVVP